MENAIKVVDELEEKMYISDIRDNKIVYINKKLREYLKVDSCCDYSGKMADELFAEHQSLSSYHIDELVRFKWLSDEESKSDCIKTDKKTIEKDVPDQRTPYRLHVVFDERDGVEEVPFAYYRKGKEIIKECLKCISSGDHPDDSIQKILTLFGETFCCERTYIFEIENGNSYNTYEWCDQGISEQKHTLQNLQRSDMEWWLRCIEKEKQIVIQNLEDIRKVSPIEYSFLKPQNIQSLAVVALTRGERMIGFWGVDNPSCSGAKVFVPILRIVSHFISSLMKSRNDLRKIERIEYKDHLTGAYNRAALFEHFGSLDHVRSVAAIYCDIVDLKKNNGMIGSAVGDRLLQECYEFISRELNSDDVYRVSGDEFAVIFTNLPELEFMKRVQYLRKRIQEENKSIIIGHAWTERKPIDLDRILARAEKVMCDEAYGNYMQNETEFQIMKALEKDGAELILGKKGNSFYNFLKKSQFDLELLFRSMSQENTTSYFFFGDLQKNLFYISDNLRDDFGFQSNIVPDFLTAWEYRIPSDKAKEMYRKDHEMLLKEKRSVHSLRYRVLHISGKSMWIRCYGILKWNEDKTKPLSFSGRITHQDTEFAEDSITSFPFASVMLKRLQALGLRYGTVRTIGFSFNSITEINNTKGRSYSDHMMRMIAEELVHELSSKMTFYRLNGMKFVAVLENSCSDEMNSLVEQIRNIIAKWYKIMGVSVHQVCSFAVMVYEKDLFSPEDYLEQMVVLIKLAKQEGTQGYEEYSEDNIAKVKRASKMALALNRDVSNGMKHFRIVIQPIVAEREKRVIGGEVLLRWKYEGEDIPPSVFIPILEKMNIIQIAGKWIFEQTVAACRRICAYNKEFRLAFNVNLQQISDGDFKDFMTEILEKYHMAGTRLIAEMTEDFMDEQPEKMHEFVEECKQMGILVALDDFGNGYSSLRRLLQYPSNIIKLDKSLLREMMESDEKKNFIASIVYACHRFGKKVCMEGVETREQKDMIKDTDCDMVQGYYYYLPLEIEEMLQLVAGL